ncbi:GumC family protein [Chamaesiphon minutus]|uniref:Capsular exopolysaccharide biosynthesis protein n=1 Tax=Chamaesiphon minutus (strain ATCC 27169 / PCC 6605) TaxID=1173020 RepID=K9UQ38_CHAP6|nr:polysaccharide biosynthesis tyrosine autokinase [Chamaesiphon minutus]AFY96778.1 capsular exopolysaccharide biosynthesis protein [Chamaesiphon minutus PCC 6605]
MSIVVKPGEDNGQESHLNRQSHSGMLNADTLGTNSDEGGLDFSQVFGAIQRRIRIVIAITILATGATIVWNRTRPPAYEGSFKVLIEPVTVEGQVVSAVTGTRASVEAQDLDGAHSSKTTLDYPTQIQLLLSSKILLPVATKLKPTYPQISYEKLKASLTIGRLKDTTETKILEVRYASRSENETKQVLNLVSNAYIQYSLSERQTNVRRAIKFVDDQLPNVKTQVSYLESALQNFREKNQLIDPTTLGSQLGVQMSNTKQEQQTTQVELAKAKQLYRSLEQQLQLQPKSAEAASVLSEAPGYQQLVKQIQDIDVELEGLSAELTDEHPKIISLREKRKKLLPLLQAKSDSLLGSNLSQSTPNAQSLPYQNALRQDLSKQFIAVATQVKVLEAKLKSLNEASQILATETGKLPIISRQYENLQRQLKIATEQLSKFLQKREELMINAARQEVPWEIIAAPSVGAVSSSGLLKDVVLGSILGLLIGSGAALVVDKMNDVIYSIKDLREEINIAILGLIPQREDERKALKHANSRKDKGILPPLSEDDEIVHHYRFSPFIESFRALNSQLRLLNPDLPIRSLVVSSALPNEGKTTIAIQLAQAAAAMGQRVLLVNADLRKPSLQNLVDRHHNRETLEGLTDVIAGTTKLMDTVQLLPGETNLFVLLAGSVTLDPTSILSSKKMQELVQNCEHNFDLVIYDTVPLNFADSLLLIPQTDGLLMVTRLGKVHREALRNALRTLEVSKVAVLGTVVNMVDDPGIVANYGQNSTKRKVRS